MAHPLVRLAASRPHMLAEHVSAYAELLADEMTATAAQLKRQLVFQVVGLCSFSISTVLIGVAAMLWSALPSGSLHAPWMLAAIPVVPAALGIWALNVGRTVAPSDPFAVIRRQLSADAAMLHNASHTGES